MQSITINIKNDQLADKVTWLLDHFKNDGLEIIAKEDWDGCALNIMLAFCLIMWSCSIFTHPQYKYLL